jgi:PEP-CTERM/exosortase A-associated glycosyltransferase
MDLRVLHVLDHSLPLQSGYTFRTLSILKEQRALGWETFHLTSPKQSSSQVQEEEIDGWHFYRTPSPITWRSRWAGLRELNLMRQLEQRLHDVAVAAKPQLLHAHSPVLNAIPALRVGKRLGIPVVYEVRAFWEDAAVDHGTTREGSLRYRLTHHLETRAMRRADHVFTICGGLRNDIVDRGIPTNKVTVVPNAVDIDAFGRNEPAHQKILERLGFAQFPVIGFIGSFYAYEGLDLLLDAIPGVAAKLPDVRVLLVGGGPQEDSLKAQATRLRITDKVVFAGRVPHEQIQSYYECVDVLAYPRHSMRLTELVTPLKPLEAMAQRRIVVASDVGGHRELIRHGETGLLFRAGSVESLRDTLLDVIARKDLWPQLRRAGRKFVEEDRTWRRSVDRYASVYQALLSGSSAWPHESGQGPSATKVMP